VAERRTALDAVAVCHIVETGNESHRVLHSSAVAKKRTKAREQARKTGKQPPPEVDI